MRVHHAHEGVGEREARRQWRAPARGVAVDVVHPRRGAASPRPRPGRLPAVDDHGPPTTKQERRAAVAAWRAVPFRVRKDVVRAAARGEAHPDEDAVRAAAAYAGACLRPRGPHWYQRPRADRFGGPVLLVLALVLLLEAGATWWSEGAGSAAGWSVAAVGLYAALAGWFVVALRRECLQILAPGSVPHRSGGLSLPLDPVAGQRASTAVGGIAVLYAGGWGLGLYSAVAYLVAPDASAPSGWLDAGASITDSLCAGALVLWAALLFARSRGVPARDLGLRLPRGRRQWWTATAVGAACTVLMWLGFVAGDLVSAVTGGDALDYPEGPSTADAVGSLVGSLAAGPTEEVVLLAVPVVLLRRAGWSWGWVLVVDLVMRVSFHAYYGWGCLGLAVWLLGVFALYVRTGHLLALVLAHSLWDVVQTVQGTWASGPLGLELLAAAAVLTVLGAVTGAFRRRTDTAAPALPAPRAGDPAVVPAGASPSPGHRRD